jgi:hypothetical protein
LRSAAAAAANFILLLEEKLVFVARSPWGVNTNSLWLLPPTPKGMCTHAKSFFPSPAARLPAQPVLETHHAASLSRQSKFALQKTRISI